MGIENPVHLAFIAVVALLVLGPKRLPELARALGKGVREFRDAMSMGADGEQRPALPAPPPAPPPPQDQSPPQQAVHHEEPQQPTTPAE